MSMGCVHVVQICTPSMPHLYCMTLFIIVPLPSTKIIALETSSFESTHSTIDGLFCKEISWKVKLAGLANTVSCELNPGSIFKLDVVMGTWMLLEVVKFTLHSRIPPKLLLQVNVTFPLSGTTYPPGIGSASDDRVTVKTNTELSDSCTYCTTSLASYGVKSHKIRTDLRQLLL